MAAEASRVTRCRLVAATAHTPKRFTVRVRSVAGRGRGGQLKAASTEGLSESQSHSRSVPVGPFAWA